MREEPHIRAFDATGRPGAMWWTWCFLALILGIAALFAYFSYTFWGRNRDRGHSPSEANAGPQGPVKKRQQSLRIVSLSPSLSSLIASFGDIDALVGVDQHSRSPDTLTQRRESGALRVVGSAFSPALEAIHALRPTHILAEDLQGSDQLDRLQSGGVQVIRLRFQTLDDITLAWQEVGALLGREALVRRSISDLEHSLSAVNFRGDPPRVLMVYGGPGVEIDAIGPRNYQSDILTRLGARNVLESFSEVTPRLGAERVFELNPDLIIELNPEEAPDDMERAKRWGRFARLPCMERGSFVLVTGRQTWTQDFDLVKLVWPIEQGLRDWVERTRPVAREGR